MKNLKTILRERPRKCEEEELRRYYFRTFNENINGDRRRLNKYWRQFLWMSDMPETLLCGSVLPLMLFFVFLVWYLVWLNNGGYGIPEPEAIVEDKVFIVCCISAVLCFVMFWGSAILYFLQNQKYGFYIISNVLCEISTRDLKTAEEDCNTWLRW